MVQIEKAFQLSAKIHTFILTLKKKKKNVKRANNYPFPFLFDLNHPSFALQAIENEMFIRPLAES